MERTTPLLPTRTATAPARVPVDVTGANELLARGLCGLLAAPGGGLAPRLVRMSRAGLEADHVVIVVEDPELDFLEAESREALERASHSVYAMAVPRPWKGRCAEVHGADAVLQHRWPVERMIGMVRDVARRPVATTPHDLLEHGLRLGLSPRAVDVAIRITRGYGNAEIAQELCLSINTVKTYIRQIFATLETDNRIEASYWYRRGA